MSKHLCLICDNIISINEGRKARKKYCSPECRLIDQLGYTLSDITFLKANEKRRQFELAERKNAYTTIEICRKAARVGLSYGIYVAKHNI